MPENFLEINWYFALTSYCNTTGQSNKAYSILGFSLAGKRRVHECFDLFIHWLIKQIKRTLTETIFQGNTKIALTPRKATLKGYRTKFRPVENLCSHRTTLTVRKFRRRAVRKIEANFYADTVKNLTGAVWTPCPSTFLYGKRVVEWMRGTSAGRRLFGFAKAALCTLADEKTIEKSWNSTWFVSSLWTGQKYWTVELYEQNVQSIFLSRSKIRSVQFDRSLSEHARKKGCEWMTLRIKLDLST